MTESNYFTITKCKNAKNRWNIYLHQSLEFNYIIESMESLNFRLVVKTHTILIYSNKKMRITFHKEDLIQVDLFTDTFPKTQIKSLLTSIFIPSNGFGDI
jgi:hypothetical protein